MKYISCCILVIIQVVLVFCSIKDNPPIGGFPASSTAGTFVALAIPLDLPHRNVYVSYNFEANYNIIGSAEDVLPGPLHFFLPTKLKEPIDTTPSPNAYWSSLQWPYGTISRNYHKKEP
uniref:Uncharacterized protein n=1 Tax=Megaselia scalaris TaxID=36166 RepID=T1H0J9_MEGSC